jgi:hypothetical protein
LANNIGRRPSARAVVGAQGRQIEAFWYIRSAHTVPSYGLSAILVQRPCQGKTSDTRRLNFFRHIRNHDGYTDPRSWDASRSWWHGMAFALFA